MAGRGCWLRYENSSETECGAFLTGGVTLVENMSARVQEEDHKGFQKHLSLEADWTGACQRVGQVQLHRQHSRAAPELLLLSWMSPQLGGGGSPDDTRHSCLGCFLHRPDPGPDRTAPFLNAA